MHVNGFCASNWQVAAKPRTKRSVLIALTFADLCQRLGMQAAYCLHHFVMGLRPETQCNVILAQPENFDQAENLAKLKELALNTTSSSVPSAEDLAKALLGKIKSTNDTHAKPVRSTRCEPPVSTYR